MLNVTACWVLLLVGCVFVLMSNVYVTIQLSCFIKLSWTIVKIPPFWIENGVKTIYTTFDVHLLIIFLIELSFQNINKEVKYINQ